MNKISGTNFTVCKLETMFEEFSNIDENQKHQLILPLIVNECTMIHSRYLRLCIEYNCEILLRLALHSGIDPNSTCGRRWNGEAPIHLAVRSNKVHMVKILIEYGADINSEDNDSWTPLQHAALKKKEMSLTLLRYGAKYSVQHQPDYHERWQRDWIRQTNVFLILCRTNLPKDLLRYMTAFIIICP